MKPEQWRQLESLYNQAMDLEESQRASFLREVCADDDDLRQELEALLAREPQVASFLEKPAIREIAHEFVATAKPDWIGRQIGNYQFVSLVGAGGMGEVYQATDLKLGRSVAIKVVHEGFSHDLDRVARFAREARVLASLNHPNVAQIYGIEQSGEIRCIVMELVEGETLQERLRRGPIPADEALGIAKQIAEALEASHELGIVHRDLKPANVKITPDGKVKVLDFGLAKVSKHIEIEPSRAPTNVTASMSGLILGTASYMSPEQASGKKCDRTSDVWAFGCVVYEMLTARRAFEGESTAAIIGRIFETEPDWNCLPAETPQSIRKLLRRCLQKESRQRLHDIADARIEIQEALSSPVGAETTATVSIRKGWREKLAWPIAVGLALLATVLATNMALRTKQQPAQPVRLTAEIGVDANLYTIWGPSAIFSPDGTRLAFLAAEPGQPNRIYVRSLDQFQATTLSGTEGASSPFFSPDGQSIGFFAQSKLKKISAQGGTAITLCNAPTTNLGGSWGEDDYIVFPSRAQGGLFKVPAAGGTPQQLIALDKQAGESSERWPQVLPGGKAVLYASFKNEGVASSADIVVYSTSSGRRKTVAPGGSYARYVPSGHVVYAQDGTLFAVPFDLQRLEVTGQPAPILEDVLTAPANGGAQFSVSANGSLVYVPGSFTRQNVAIYWMDREGKFTPFRETPGDYYNPALSPDGKRLALEIHDAKRSDIWIDEEGGNSRRLTFSGEKNSYPVWTPDGQRIVYTSQDKEGSQNLWWIRADGTGEPQRLTQSKTIQNPRSWRFDGKVLAFRQNNAGTTGWDVMTLAIDGDEKSGWKPGEPQPFVNSASTEMEPAFSPDGRWLAYISFESGVPDVHVRPFPGPGGKWQISYGGGSYPKWAANGKELFYRTADGKITTVTYTAAGDSFLWSKPQPWSPGQFRERWQGLLMYNYDAHPDGKRFVVLKVPGTEQDLVVNKVNIVLNWLSELKQKVHR